MNADAERWRLPLLGERAGVREVVKTNFQTALVCGRAAGRSTRAPERASVRRSGRNEAYLLDRIKTRNISETVLGTGALNLIGLDRRKALWCHALMEVMGVLFGDSPNLPNLFHSGLRLYLVLGVLGLGALFVFVFFIVCLCERQKLTGDVEPASEPFPYAPTPYWKATRVDALKYGLQHAGDFATRKNTTVVKGLMSLFISQDHETLAAIVSGAFAGTKTKKTVLRSRLVSGRVLESSDEGGMDDLSGVVDRAILFNAGIAELMGFHLQRIRDSSSAAVHFRADALLQEYEKMDLERGARWVLLGLARWGDPQHTFIRMTVGGALAMVKKLFQQTRKLRGQQQRAHILRAGSRVGD